MNSPSGRHYSFEGQFSSESDGLLGDLERQSPRSSQEDLVISEKPRKEFIRSTAFLDGLRGVAALCVFNQHFIGPGDQEHGFGESGYYYFASMPFVRVFYNGGAAAVSIFFVLSGFVLSQSAFKLLYKGHREASKTSLMSAAVRRPIRLYLPCLAVTLLVAFAMQLPGNVFPDLPWSKAQPNIFAQVWHALDAFYKYFQPFQYHGNELFWFPYDIVVWTIPIELKGSYLIYAVTPVCAYGMVSQEWSAGVLIVAVMLCLRYGAWWIACFLGGLALTIIDLYDLDAIDRYRSMKRVSKHLTPRVKMVAMNVLFVIAYFLLSQVAVASRRQWSRDTPGWRWLTDNIPYAYSDAKFYRYWQTYGSILFVYCTLRLRWLQRIFSLQPLQYLGRVSFMLYLIHQPLMISIGDRFVRVFGQLGLGSEPKWWDNLLFVPDVGPRGLSLRWDINWTIMLAISLGAAHILTRFVDAPSVALGQKLSRRLGFGPPEKKPRINTMETGRMLP